MTNDQVCQHKLKYTREMGSDGNFYWVPQPSCQLCEIEKLRAENESLRIQLRAFAQDWLVNNPEQGQKT